MIRVENLCFEYSNDDGKVPVLNNMNTEIKEGDFVAILGHNGSGKSTFAKLLNGILLPTSGKVFVDENDTADEEHIFDLRSNVGMVFQNPDNQIVATVVEEDVAFALENLGIPSEEIRERVDNALKSVGLFDRRKARPISFPAVRSSE